MTSDEISQQASVWMQKYIGDEMSIHDIVKSAMFSVATHVERETIERCKSAAATYRGIAELRGTNAVAEAIAALPLLYGDKP